MFAIFKDSGKQYKVQAGDVVRLAKRDVKTGAKIEISDILLTATDDKIEFASQNDSSKVVAEVVAHGRADKVIVFKKKRRHNYRRKYGHRQDYTLVKVVGLVSPTGKEVTAKNTAKPAEAKTVQSAAAKAETAGVASANNKKASSANKSSGNKSSNKPGVSSTKEAKDAKKAKASTSGKSTTKKAAPKSAAKTTKQTAKKES